MAQTPFKATTSEWLFIQEMDDKNMQETHILIFSMQIALAHWSLVQMIRNAVFYFHFSLFYLH